MENCTLLQFFEWYYPADGSLWNKLSAEASNLKQMGIDAVWLPPAHKGIKGAQSEGYDSYDLYDIGEFDQKGTIATKYGTKQQLIDAVAVAQKAGIKVYADIVLNHMGGADDKETITVRKVNPDNRNEFISEPYQIEAFTKFTFPGRKGKYSEFVWNFECFSGVDFDDRTKETAIYSIQNQSGEGWEQGVDTENGNYDYLMFDDIETRNPHVKDELKRWGKWYYQTVKFDGFRLDAIKHIEANFYNEWLDHLRTELKQELFTVGEYWSPYDLPAMLKYIELTGGRMSLFDAPLHFHFHQASQQGKDYNLCDIFKGTLVEANPTLAVTLVENHDTQPLQSLEEPVAAWFRPLAYALILLREQGYPCVFYTDIYGSKYTDEGGDGKKHKIKLLPCPELSALLYTRKKIAYGQQRDYFDNPNCIGWTREGIDEYPNSGCAVLISNHEAGVKSMEVGIQHAGKVFIDNMAKCDEEITINPDGWGEFKVNAGSVSVWVIK
jgi:alpha-amylase